MRKKQWVAAALVGLAVILVGVGSGNVKTRQTKKDKQENTQIVSGVQIVTEDGKKYYDFQDVKENNYRARLQDQVPRNSYDFSNLALDEETGYLSYKDTKGKVSAKKGIDVSEFQGETIDWQQVKDAGFEYAILRVGYRGMTEGGLNVDSTFEQNYQGATAAGLKVGVYFFSQAITQEEAREEAQYVLDTLDGRELDYPVVFDWEIPIPSEQLPAEDLRAYDISGEVVTAMAKAFCQEIRSNGYTPCVYTNKSMAYNTFTLEELKDFPLWYAEYQPAPSLYYHFQMWQYSASGTVPGIAGSVDLNICFEPY